MDERSEQIIVQASQLFLRYGVRSLTMDDVARHLGISKKTLYQFVTDKDDLVNKSLDVYLKMDRAEMEQVLADSTDAIDEMFRITRKVGDRIKQMHPSILFDVQKYHPQAHERFMTYKREVMRTEVERNMRDGMAQGLYRDNLIIPIVARLYTARIDMLFDPELFPSQHFEQRTVFMEHMRYHIRAIASDRGIEVMKERFAQMDSNNSLF